MRTRHALSLTLAALLLCGCGVGAKKDAIATALDADGSRAEYFEATLRVLDENPAYVDELFRQARKHPRTLERFLASAAANLHEEELARMTARSLAKSPAAMRQVIIQTMDAVKNDRAARLALARAMAARREVIVDVLTDDVGATASMLDATIDALADKPEAREAFLLAMQRRAPELAGLIVQNPEALGAMMKAVLEAGAKESRDLLRELIGLPAPTPE